MLPFSWIVSISTPSSTPTPSPIVEPDPELVTPGFLGFAIVALLVVAVVLLVWDMQRRIRRTRYRAEIDAELDAEQQADAAVLASDTDDQFTDAADSVAADSDAAQSDTAAGDVADADGHRTDPDPGAPRA
mgnify:FL=1